MKKLSTYKYLYYSGLSVLILIVPLVLILLFNLIVFPIVDMNFHQTPNYVIRDTIRKEVVIYDTIVQKVSKTPSLPAKLEERPVKEVGTTPPPTVLDTTK